MNQSPSSAGILGRRGKNETAGEKNHEGTKITKRFSSQLGQTRVGRLDQDLLKKTVPAKQPGSR
jgi:hypothetical protein